MKKNKQYIIYKPPNSLFASILLSSDLLAVMPFVAHSGTLSTATQGPCQTTCFTLKNVLFDMFPACPCKATGVITAEHL